jgi:hypothetical protein
VRIDAFFKKSIEGKKQLSKDTVVFVVCHEDEGEEHVYHVCYTEKSEAYACFWIKTFGASVKKTTLGKFASMNFPAMNPFWSIGALEFKVEAKNMGIL